MAPKLDPDGSVALYGILLYGDTNKATLKPESSPTLDKRAKLLNASKKLQLLVVGYTDNVGDFACNMKLSQQRADAVVHELFSTYGIESARLRPAGVSYACPVAPNSTEEG